MSLFRGTMRPPAVLSDEAIDRYLAEVRAQLDPDPLFRRRLRGVVMNQYVAGREGMVAPPIHRAMGRLGRAVLYASFTLALSATTVLAASREALPGDPLYALKRQVEDLRFQVLPANLHDDLAAYALAERIDELARLAERGDWALVESLAITVERDFAAFVASTDVDGTESSDKYLTVLNALLDRLPDPARDAVEAVIDRAWVRNATAPERATRGGLTPATGNRGGSDGTKPVVGGPADDDPDARSNDLEPPVTPQPKPTKSPKPDPAPLAEATPRPEPSTRPSRAPSSSSDDANEVDEVDDTGEVDGSED